MRSSAALAIAALAFCACPQPHHEPVDAGPDTSCGLDCAAQAQFGLITGRCFEYSADPNTPETFQYPFVIWVPPLSTGGEKQPFTIEGNVVTLRVNYLVGTLQRGYDLFTIPNGTLTLARRNVQSGGTDSITYFQDGKIDGVQWLPSGTVTGAEIETVRDAKHLNDTVDSNTSYRITTTELTSELQKTVNNAFSTDGGFAMIYGESPAHFADALRVFVPGLGFTQITPTARIVPAVPYYLQNVRDIDPDGGTPCGIVQ